MSGLSDVAIIMGSQSDWATMRHAAETLGRARRRLRRPDRLGPSHARPARRLRQGREGRGLQGHHRRRGRGRASARHDGRDDAAAGLRRAGGIQGAVGPGQPALHRPDAGRASRSARSPSAAPARSTRRFWPRPSWRCTIRRSPSASTRGGRRQTDARGRAPLRRGHARSMIASRRHPRHPRRRPARPHDGHRGGAARPARCHVYRAGATAPPSTWRAASPRAPTRTRRRSRASPQGCRRRHLRVRERAAPDRRDPRSAQAAARSEPAGARRSTQDRLDGKDVHRRPRHSRPRRSRP